MRRFGGDLGAEPPAAGGHWGLGAKPSCRRMGVCGRHVASQKFLEGQGQIMEGQNFFVYSDENEGIKCLYRYYTRIAIITSRRVHGIL